MIELIIQGEELDLFKNEEFAISKAVSKIGQFDLRFGDVSISFNVPLTAKNNRIFRYISNLNNSNIGAFKRFDGEIRENDSILSQGYYQVFKVNQNKKSINIRFLGGNSDWFDLIKDRFINVDYPKLDNNPNSNTYSLNYLNHRFERLSITGSRNNTDGYFYFICDTGIDSDKSDNDVTLQDFQLGVYEHTIVKNIFDSIGIKLKGSMFNDPLYYSTIVNQPTDLTEYATQNNSKSFRVNQNQIVPQVVQGNASDFGTILFQRSDQDTQWNGSVFTSEYDNDSVIFNGKISTDSETTYFNINNATIDVRVLVNGVEPANTRQTITVDTNVSSTCNLTFSDYDFQFDGLGDLPVLSIGDTVEFQYRANVNDDDFKPTVQTTGSDDYLQSAFYYTIEGAITDFNIIDALPKIKQSDFIKDIMFRLGVVSTYDSKKRILYLNKFQDVENNKTKAIDLTSKIDVSKDIEIDFNKVVSNYYRDSYLRYQEDDKDFELILFKAVAKNGLGDGLISIDNDNLTDEGDIFTSQYAATKDKITWSGNFYLPYIPIYNADGTTNDLKPRILITNIGETANTSTLITNYSTSFSQITYDVDGSNWTVAPYAYFAKQITGDNGIGVLDNGLDLNLQTLSFQNYELNGQAYIGNTLIEKNFSLYKKILNNPVYLPIYLNINNLDVQNYDPLIPVWLDFGLDSGYYYWEEISQYKADGTTTKCPLIKI
jgi:hypothetical protein